MSIEQFYEMLYVFPGKDVNLTSYITEFFLYERCIYVLRVKFGTNRPI